MSATTNASCCCGGLLYYALKCPDFFSDYCCTPSCGSSPPRIDLCPSYLAALGIPVPPPPNFCYYIGYDCCVYVLAGFELTNCPNPASPYPTNVGWLAHIAASGGLPCCRPISIPQSPPGGIADTIIEGCGPVVSIPVDPCTELIAECYEKCDQYGTVEGKEIIVSSVLSICVNVEGVPWNVRCDHGPPDTIYNITRKVSQEVGPCVPWLFINGVAQPMPQPTPQSCPNEITQRWEQEWACPDCFPFADCCGGFNPCDGDPNACAGTKDPRNTFTVRTCYSVQDCEGNNHVEDLFVINFPACFATNAGVDINDPVAVDAYVRNFLVFIDPAVGVQTCWDDGAVVDVPELQVCNLKIQMLSASVEDIVERINNRIGALARAYTLPPWSDWFWFGYRQTCNPCPWEELSARPPYIAGDTMQIGTIYYDASFGVIRVFMQGIAVRKFVCVSQGMNSEFNCRGIDHPTVACSISATGEYPFQLQCLSVPEYSSGLRYDMLRVEELADNTTICTASFPSVIVPLCDYRYGWPLDDIIVTPPLGPPTLVQYGWNTLCQLMPDPQSACYCYPFDYVPAPCCPIGTEDCVAWEAAHPLPEPCVLSFQDGFTYCKTQGENLAIRSCDPI